MFSRVQVGQRMDQRRQDPGHRIGQKQDILCGHPCKNGCKPQDPEQAGAGQGDDHGRERVAKSPHDTHDDFHDPAEKIGGADPEEPCASCRDDGGVCGIDAKERFSQQVDAHTHDEPDHGHQPQSGKEDPVDPVCFPGAGVLACEADRRLMDCIHGDIDKLLDAHGSAVAGHDDGAEGIDGGLDQHIGKGEQRSLYSGRQPDLHHPAQTERVDVELSDIEPAGTLHPAQTEQDQYGTDALGNDRCQRYAGHIHVQDDDEEQVQYHVHHTGHGQEVQRLSGISGGPQDGAPEVVDHGGGHSDEDDLQVERSLVKNVQRRPHPDQKRPGEKHSHANEQDAGDHADGDGCVHIILGSFFIPASQRMPHGYIGSDGQSDKEVDQQVGERTGGANGGQRLIAGKSADYDHVCGIEEKLQAAGEHQGQAEGNDSRQQRAVAHIDLVRFSGHFGPLRFLYFQYIICSSWTCFLKDIF